MQQGRCVLSPDGSGRVLDRLAGLDKVITPAVIGQVLLATNRVNQRACKLTHEVMLWVVLAMGILTDLPIRQVFKHARRLRMGQDAPHRSSLCVARQRLGIPPIRHLFQEVVQPLAKPDTSGAFYQGLRLMGIDGTVLNVPDTPAKVLARIKANLVLEPVERLSGGSYLAKIYPNAYARQKDRDSNSKQMAVGGDSSRRFLGDIAVCPTNPNRRLESPPTVPFSGTLPPESGHHLQFEIVTASWYE